MAIDVSKALDIGEHGQFISDGATGAEIFWTGAGASVPAFDLPCPGRYFRENGLIYFNSTGANGNWIVEAGSTDHQSAWKELVENQTVLVNDNKQMTVAGNLTNCGTLENSGEIVTFV